MKAKFIENKQDPRTTFQDFLNLLFTEKCGSVAHDLAMYGNAFIKIKMQEESFARKILRVDEVYES
jgi:hypothetical protein